MKQAQLFPKISAQVLNSPNNKDEYFLFNASTNKGFSIDGLAADLCKKFNGEMTLEQTIKTFEIEQQLKMGEFESEIDSLIQDLEKNCLLVFLEEAQPTVKK